VARAGFDVAVIGAGVVGLACAAALARSHRRVLILERHDTIVRETSSHNSEVIHAGLYYPEGSLKARTCARGRALLYERCREWRVDHRRVGKLVVASAQDELEVLGQLLRQGGACGAPGLELLSSRELERREPTIRGVAALWSPDSGIVDSHAYALSFLAEAERSGALLSTRSDVQGIRAVAGGYELAVARPGGEREQLSCAVLVNAAGLASDRIAELAGLDLDAAGYRQHLCKGDYFSALPASRIALSHLVYPVPSTAGLGVHATIDLAGRVRFGPDATYVPEPSYVVDPAKAPLFEAAVRRYLPGLPAGSLAPDSAGLRPKLAAPGEGFRDFVVAEESDKGRPGLVSCIGIESPGLTAAAAIAETVAELLRSL